MSGFHALVLVIIAALALLLAPTEVEGQKLFLVVTRTVGGVIATSNKPDNGIPILEFHHSLSTPTAASSGLSTGKRQHSPFTVRKSIDKATPLLFTALVTNEVLKSIELRYYTTTLLGVSSKVYTILLENVQITAIRDLATETGKEQVQDIEFSYQKITWTWVDGGVTATDNWSTPAFRELSGAQNDVNHNSLMEQESNIDLQSANDKFERLAARSLSPQSHKTHKRKEIQ